VQLVSGTYWGAFAAISSQAFQGFFKGVARGLLGSRAYEGLSSTDTISKRILKGNRRRYLTLRLNND
ncbi:MAG: hypothetical protein WC662_03345, partial [Candidatus Paceibacterota bacterium]